MCCHALGTVRSFRFRGRDPRPAESALALPRAGRGSGLPPDYGCDGRGGQPHQEEARSPLFLRLLLSFFRRHSSRRSDRRRPFQPHGGRSSRRTRDSGELGRPEGRLGMPPGSDGRDVHLRDLRGNTPLGVQQEERPDPEGGHSALWLHARHLPGFLPCQVLNLFGIIRFVGVLICW